MRTLFTTLVLLANSFSYAQFQQLNWIMGATKMKISFNYNTNSFGSATVLGNSYTGEGNCVANNPSTGNLMFYSNGYTIYDSGDQIMLNGSSLTSHESSYQTAQLVPMPGNSNQYYIFTSNSVDEIAAGNIYYSVVDMSLVGNGTANDPKGAVLTTNKNTLVASNVCEGFAIIRKTNTDDYWLICVGSNTSSLKLYTITSSGCSLVSTTSLGATLQYVRSIKYSPEAEKISICSMSDDEPQLIFNFNNTTGVISNKLQIPGTPLGTEHNYWRAYFDTEWSSDGTKLYIAQYRNASLSDISLTLQYDLNNPTQAPFILNTSTNKYIGGKGLKTAPDGKIYLIYLDGSTTKIGRINNPNLIGNACGLEENVIQMSQNIGNTHSFPAFLPPTTNDCTTPPTLNLVSQSNTSAPNACDGEITVQTSGGTSPYQYEINGNEFATTNFFAALCNGTYTITVSDSTTCSASITVIVQTETVSNPCANSNLSVSISAVNPTTSCNGTATANASGGTSPYTYSWSNLYFTQSIGNLCTGTYSVVITDINGCIASASKTITGTSSQPLQVFLQQHNSTGVAQCNGRAKVNASGGVPPYSFVFSNGTTGNLAIELCAGMYTVTVTDAVGSQASYQFIISHPTNTNWDSTTVRPDSTLIANLTHNAIENCNLTYNDVDSVRINSFHLNPGYDSVVVNWVIYSAGSGTTQVITYPIGNNGVYSLQLNIYCPSRSEGASMIGMAQVYIDKTTIITEKEKHSNVISPNPFVSDFTVNEAYIGGTITIFNASGKTICKSNIQHQKINFLNDYPSGIYLIQIEKNGRTSRSKLIKE